MEAPHRQPAPPPLSLTRPPQEVDISTRYVACANQDGSFLCVKNAATFDEPVEVFYGSGKEKVSLLRFRVVGDVSVERHAAALQSEKKTTTQIEEARKERACSQFHATKPSKLGPPAPHAEFPALAQRGRISFVLNSAQSGVILCGKLRLVAAPRPAQPATPNLPLTDYYLTLVKSTNSPAILLIQNEYDSPVLHTVLLRPETWVSWEGETIRICVDSSKTVNLYFQAATHEEAHTWVFRLKRLTDEADFQWREKEREMQRVTWEVLQHCIDLTEKVHARAEAEADALQSSENLQLGSQKYLAKAANVGPASFDFLRRIKVYSLNLPPPHRGYIRIVNGVWKVTDDVDKASEVVITFATAPRPGSSILLSKVLFQTVETTTCMAFRDARNPSSPFLCEHRGVAKHAAHKEADARMFAYGVDAAASELPTDLVIPILHGE